MDWDTFVGGHVARAGTHADVDQQAEFNRDVKQAAAAALAATKPGEGLNPLDKAQPVGRLRQLHRSGCGPMRQYPHAQMVHQARRL